MPPIPKTKAYYIMQLNLVLATFIYAIGHFLTALFTIFIILGIGRLLLMLFWALEKEEKKKRFGFACFRDLS
jgi:hypothetical protein